MPDLKTRVVSYDLLKRLLSEHLGVDVVRITTDPSARSFLTIEFIAAPADYLPGLNREAWELWIKNRREYRLKAYTARGREAVMKKLISFGGPDEQMAAVKQSIENGWQGLFKAKDQQKRTRAQDDELRLLERGYL